ncbi:MAG: hypothetical protein R3250_07595 [Melioribacteraceae bacterium]|nr:hypothetical protein [Melioribacteraceae bacterium]
MKKTLLSLALMFMFNTGYANEINIKINNHIIEQAKKNKKNKIAMFYSILFGVASTSVLTATYVKLEKRRNR